MHGAGLAAMALLVRQRFDDIVLPSAYDLAGLAPAGSHPAIDPLWSSPSTRIHHDHLDRGRHEKVAWLARERPDLLPHLKVCYQHSTQTNCGQYGTGLGSGADSAGCAVLHVAGAGDSGSRVKSRTIS